jgi:hypothetical protein
MGPTPTTYLAILVPIAAIAVLATMIIAFLRTSDRSGDPPEDDPEE